MDFYCDQVLSGRLAVLRIAETEHVLAFHHTQPYWPVHIVVVPKRHISSLATLEPGDLPVVHELLTVAADLCRRVTEEHGGCRLSSNSGNLQTTRHLHFYIHSGLRLRNEDGTPVDESVMAWADDGSVQARCIAPHGDPVDMSSGEARNFARLLITCADEADSR